MIPLSIRFHPDREEVIFPEIEEHQGVEAILSEVVVVANGMDASDLGQGETRPSVILKLELPEGKIGVAMTSARLFCAFADMIRAKHPKAFEAP